MLEGLFVEIAEYLNSTKYLSTHVLYALSDFFANF